MEVIQNNILFLISLFGIYVMVYLWIKDSELLMRRIFCFNRKENMLYDVRYGVKCVAIASIATMVLYEIIGLLWMKKHLWLQGVCFIILLYVLEWLVLETLSVRHNVIFTMITSSIMVLLPWITMFIIWKWRVHFDTYMGLGSVLLVVLDMIMVFAYKKAWKEGDY